MSFNLLTSLEDVIKYLPVVNQIVAANVQQSAAGASKVQIIITDAGAVAQLAPAPIGEAITVGIDVTEEVLSLVSAIKGLNAKTAPAPSGAGAVAA